VAADYWQRSGGIILNIHSSQAVGVSGRLWLR
jgi:hypothetical protein